MQLRTSYFTTAIFTGAVVLAWYILLSYIVAMLCMNENRSPIVVWWGCCRCESGELRSDTKFSQGSSRDSFVGPYSEYSGTDIRLRLHLHSLRSLNHLLSTTPPPILQQPCVAVSIADTAEMYNWMMLYKLFTHTRT